MNQVTLWHEDIYEALGTDVQAAGGNKTVGHVLWPEKSPCKAADHLSNCLNRTRNEKLDPEQVILVIGLARKAGASCTMNFICTAADFEQPVPVEPEDEMARLQRDTIEMGKTLQATLTRLEEISKRVAKK